jgi:hypothetical protein
VHKIEKTCYQQVLITLFSLPGPHPLYASANEILKQVQNDGPRLVAKNQYESARQFGRITAPSFVREDRGELPFLFEIGVFGIG